MKHCRRLACVAIALVLCCQVTSFAATQGEENALRSASNYLEYMGFSHDGLIEQLEYDKYTHEEAVYAADNCGADWNENALKSANNYLEYMGFSHDGLIEQLEYDKYTPEEAQYAADNCGADWNENAVKSANNYLEYMGFSYEGLIEQLEYDKYTHEEAVYAADVAFNGDTSASTPEPTAEPVQVAVDVPIEPASKGMPATSDAEDAPVIYQALQRGDSGEEVVKLQRALVALGYLSGAADGIFGGATEAAVEAFQKAKGLQVTRVADNPTLQILYASISIDDSLTYNDYANSPAAEAPASGEAAEPAGASAEEPAAAPSAAPEATPEPAPTPEAERAGGNEAASAAASNQMGYDQIVSIIDAIKIDGVKVFTDGKEMNFDASQEASRYPNVGASFIWLADENRGVLQVYDPLFVKDYHQWDCLDIAMARIVMEVLTVAVPQYVYDMGGMVAFAIATGEDFYNPQTIYGYNPSKGGASEIEQYADAKEFCEAVKADLDSLPAPEGSSSALSRGSKGEEVTKLQNRLNELGYSVGTADGDFGGKTERAIIAFQELNGLTANGIADAQTLAAIYSDSAVQPTPTPKPTAKPTAKPKKSSSGSSSLLSESDCKELARFYLSMRVGSATVQLIDATTDGNQCLVAIQYTAGGSTKISGFLIDRRDGSLLYVQ